MKFTISRELFASTLSAPASVCKSDSINPILSYIPLEANSGTLAIQATSGEMFAASSCAVDIEVPGTILVPGEQLTSLIASFPLDQVNFELSGTQVLISGGRAKYKLPAAPAEHVFPTLNFSEGTVIAEVPAKLLKAWLSTALPFVDGQSKSMFARGVWINTDQGKLTISATDTYAVIINRDQIAAADGDCVIDGKDISVLLRSMPDAEDVTARLSIAKNRLMVEYGNSKLSLARMDLKFPSVDKAIPTEISSTITVNNKDFAGALTRLLKFTQAKGLNPAAVMEVKEGSLGLAAHQGEKGDGTEEIEAAHSGKPIAIKFSPPLMLMAIKSLPAGDIRIACDERKIMLVTSNAAPHCVLIVMPIYD